MWQMSEHFPDHTDNVIDLADYASRRDNIDRSYWFEEAADAEVAIEDAKSTLEAAEARRLYCMKMLGMVAIGGGSPDGAA
jgi:hypothetical protein